MTLDESLFASMANAQLAEDLYQCYLNNPNSIDEKWRRFFEEFDSVSEEALLNLKQTEKILDSEDGEEKLQVTSTSKKKNKKSQEKGDEELGEENALSLQAKSLSRGQGGDEDFRIYNLIYAYRTYGHLLATTNPIATCKSRSAPELDLKELGFEEASLLKYFPTFGLLQKENTSLQEIIDTLKEIYCGNIGFEYMSMGNPRLEKWLQKQIEPTRSKVDLTIEEKQMILQQLNKSELFESFLHTKFVGQKRFSLEGGETLIPILMSIIELGAEIEMEEFVIGMAHRGRLNVLSNILNKSYEEIFSEFEESYIPGSCEGSGDVKYHKGYTSKLSTSKGHEVCISLADNPSHLEAVGGVVEGITRAKQVLLGDDTEMKRVVPILIHGDASISGQGVVYEVLQFSRLPGYSTGGTIHIVVNNQIGFTTLPKDGRSTMYCTDISKAFSAPVFHVNAEDPESCIYATHLAMRIRQMFHCDVFICLDSYRKFGHNEGDEPAFTQPLEYKLIRKKKPIREIYRDNLIQQGVLEKYMAEVLEEEFKKSLQNALKETKIIQAKQEKSETFEGKAKKLVRKTFDEVKTSVSLKTLQKLADRFCSIPEGFNVHKKVLSLIKQRLNMVHSKEDEKVLDWGMAEHLAFASLVKEGVHVRLSGQDSRRGTFSHRHAVWTDQDKGKKFCSLNHIAKKQGRFDVFNSPLSEFAILGFEFGYTLAYSKALLIWEAQFGDFSNGAQVIIDQFIATGEQKWGICSNIVLFLPHGFEGQGPEHSSARMERFLQLCGDENIQVVNPTTPAQLFHLLRRQVIRDLKKPLIVFTPKGLLRDSECVSSMHELVKGKFIEAIDDEEAPDKVQRLIFCSGRVYYDLFKERKRRERDGIAIMRIEQLYPFHQEKVKTFIDKYKGFKECYWVQEEPRNMGAWNFVKGPLQEILPKQICLKYIGRGRSASPAVGSYALHKKEYVAIMNEVFAKGEQQLFEMSSESISG